MEKIGLGKVVRFIVCLVATALVALVVNGVAARYGVDVSCYVYGAVGAFLPCCSVLAR